MSDMPKNTCVWFEIPVSDLDASKRFYEEVLSISMRRDDTGPNPMVMFSSMDDMGVSGHLYPGKPSEAGSGNTIHLAVDGSLDDAMSRVKAAGGQVMSPTIDIPAGSFFYATDPDGNSIGLFTYN
ncbi:VOC family protein [Oricola sp.]|uniref:VOC family protein n=1 Tax=Oricola sp. TaxID=1979950 RepID=UPI000C8BE7F0|nr:glyoxalase [Ahrensia sp.]MCK5744603.1 VOC family protein [Oricola sp.]|tara:strand:- start:13163 stop:13537 length:375 start_codon:yes stop_codon:yes gene_type:complete